MKGFTGGFTLIELLVVIAITTLLLVFTLPTTIKFFETQTLVDTSSTLLSSLRSAQSQALFQKNDSAFGVKFLSGSYVLFQGSSYSSRVTSEDIVITTPNTITISGISEVVFTKRTGLPSTTGTILIQSGTRSLSLSISQQGIIQSL